MQIYVSANVVRSGDGTRNHPFRFIQEAADITATQRPEDLFERNVQHNAIFLSVAKNELDSLMRYGNWQELLSEGSFSTIEGKSFYPFEDIVPDFYAFLPGTIFIKDSGEKLIGAVTAEAKMNEICFHCAPIESTFKIENNGFKFLKMPKSSVKIVFMYRSNAVCTDAKTFEKKKTLSANTDVPIFDQYLVKLGIIWRWLKRNGMDYEEEYNEYQKELKKKFALSLAIKDIHLSKGLNAFENEACLNVVINKN